jgi:hypothetical protein
MQDIKNALGSLLVIPSFFGVGFRESWLQENLLLHICQVG